LPVTADDDPVAAANRDDRRSMKLFHARFRSLNSVRYCNRLALHGAGLEVVISRCSP
jgi:hypothetical protein